jgi:hypothetical protein
LACYCGTSGTACFSGGRNGPCAAIMEAGLETTDGATIAARFTNPEFGGGLADLRITTDWDNCRAECFNGK